jgi:hypothetical protein
VVFELRAPQTSKILKIVDKILKITKTLKNIKKKKLFKLSFRLENKESFEKEAKSFELKNVKQVVFCFPNPFRPYFSVYRKPSEARRESQRRRHFKKAKIHHMVKSFKYLLSIKNMLKILNPYFKVKFH